MDRVGAAASGTEGLSGWLICLCAMSERQYNSAMVKPSAPARDTLESEDADALHAQKIDALGHLAASVAHDFNNILAVILSSSNFLLEDLPPDSPMRQDAKEIEQAVVRATALTRRLLVFARKQVMEPRVLDPLVELESLATFLRRLLRGGTVLELDVPKRLSRLWCDPVQFEQMITNLVVNARDAMQQGGTITLAARNFDLPESGVAEYPGLAPGRYVEIAVSDTGVGISPENQARIFEPYFTTKAVGVGTGIGLATVMAVVRQAGGGLHLTSSLGGGATFRVLLPRGKIAGDPTVMSARPPPDVRGTETVLVVDDDDQVLRVVRRILGGAGYVTLGANSPGEALLVAEQHPAPIHLLVADLQMPRMTGSLLADRLKGLRPELQVLFMSGHSVEGLGAELLLKPFKPLALLGGARAALSGRR